MGTELAARAETESAEAGAELARQDAWRTEMEEQGDREAAERERREALEREREEKRKAEREELRKTFPALLPMGHLTLLVGDPGVGKSLVALDYAARMATGRAVYPAAGAEAARREAGDERDFPYSIYISAEDSVEETQARVRAWGTKKVVVLEESYDLVPRKEERGEESALAGFLRREVKERGCGLVVLDPLPAFLGGFDMRGAVAVRRLIKPLLRMGEHYGFAVLGVTHLSKGRKSGNVLHRTMGSLAYTALARSVVAVVEDEGQAGRKLAVPVKSNLGALGRAWGFRIVERGGAAGVEWEAEGEREAGVLPGGVLRGRSEEEGLAAGRLEMALEFLRVELAEGPKGTKEVMREAFALGIARRTLERARRVLGVGCWFEMEGRRWVMGTRDAVKR